MVSVLVVILADARWYLIEMLTYISLMINDDEYIFKCLLIMCIYILARCLLKLFLFNCYAVSMGAFVTPWTAAHQTSLSFTISWSLLKLPWVSDAI